MKFEPKHIIGLVAMLCFCGIQITAFVMGYNGQILTITTNALIGIIGYLLGIDITQKKVLKENNLLNR